MTTSAPIPFKELTFSKNYETAFGISKYLTRKIELKGELAFNYNEEYKSITLRLNQKSIEIIEEVNRLLEKMEYPVIKINKAEVNAEEFGWVNKTEGFGTNCYIKVKRDIGVKSFEKGTRITLGATLSLFKSKTGKCFSSLSV